MNELWLELMKFRSRQERDFRLVDTQDSKPGDWNHSDKIAAHVNVADILDAAVKYAKARAAHKNGQNELTDLALIIMTGAEQIEKHR